MDLMVVLAETVTPLGTSLAKTATSAAAGTEPPDQLAPFDHRPSPPAPVHITSAARPAPDKKAQARKEHTVITVTFIVALLALSAFNAKIIFKPHRRSFMPKAWR
ncbi:MAG TPA: hypothetical protein P5026_06705 [Kiritimatiellia bacterium]|nr:hypothetical protein [Kiritimatiellia bacterium]HRU70077.1 hypothetical protein [Kiritimatiellia bacterium]